MASDQDISTDTQEDSLGTAPQRKPLAQAALDEYKHVREEQQVEQQRKDSAIFESIRMLASGIVRDILGSSDFAIDVVGEPRHEVIETEFESGNAYIADLTIDGLPFHLNTAVPRVIFYTPECQQTGGVLIEHPCPNKADLIVENLAQLGYWLTHGEEALCFEHKPKDPELEDDDDPGAPLDVYGAEAELIRALRNVLREDRGGEFLNRNEPF